MERFSRGDEVERSTMSVGSGRVYHVNINCSALDRSLGLYRDVLGLVPVVLTAPDAAQNGAAFGLASAQWEAWILGSVDAPAGSGPLVDLLKWKVPGPVPMSEDAIGARGTGFRAAVFARRDPQEQCRRLEAAGVTVSSADPASGTGQLGAREVRDHDGTALEVVGAERDAFAGVVVGCSDLSASLSFYRDRLGFTLEHEAEEGPDRARAVLADAGGFRVHLRELGGGTRSGRLPANALGIFRVALLTTDIAADYAELCSAGIYCWSPPADLEMGSSLGSLKAMLFADPDGATWELIEPGPR
jgi:catechol 2,3-dioxygenase-like lactoylglutathione lyase family enzyme